MGLSCIPNTHTQINTHYFNPFTQMLTHHINLQAIKNNQEATNKRHKDKTKQQYIIEAVKCKRVISLHAGHYPSSNSWEEVICLE